jgi:translation initiation factor IF-3
MKLRPKIDAHDYETKKGHVVRFLKAGDKVKITIMFRGREQSRPELGFRLLKKLADDVADIAFVEYSPKQDGRNMIMVLGPVRKKADAMAEAKAEKDSAKARNNRPALDDGDLGDEDPATDLLLDENLVENEAAPAEVLAEETSVAELGTELEAADESVAPA